MEGREAVGRAGRHEARVVCEQLPNPLVVAESGSLEDVELPACRKLLGRAAVSAVQRIENAADASYTPFGASASAAAGSAGSSVRSGCSSKR
jgi:hypothetical protein